MANCRIALASTSSSVIGSSPLNISHLMMRPQLQPQSSATRTHFQACSKAFRFQEINKFFSPNSVKSTLRCSMQDELLGANREVGLDSAFAVKNMAAEISSELKGTSIFLVGTNSPTKTKIGNVLADALRYYYFDSDSLVMQAAGGESAANSFRERDEKGFLDSETEVLRQLTSLGRLVVCAGDGAVQSSTNLGLLRHGISIWIDIPIDILAREVIKSGGQTDPAYQSEVQAKLTASYERMKDGYGIADATVSLQKVASKLGYEDMDTVIAEDMVVEALKEIEKLTRVKKMMEAAARPF